jgi:hypothetical protein
VPLAEGGFDAAQQLVSITGFLQAGNQSRSVGAKVRGYSKISGDEYSGDVEALRNELLMHLYTAHSRHLDIENQAVYFSGTVPVEKLQCAAIRSNFITAGSQQASRAVRMKSSSSAIAIIVVLRIISVAHVAHIVTTRLQP